MKNWSCGLSILFFVASTGLMSSCAQSGAEYPPLKTSMVDDESDQPPAPLEPAANAKGESESDQPAPVQSTSKPAASHDESSQVRTLPHGFVEIPAGSFMQGSPPGEEGRYDDEGPQRQVTFSRSFLLKATPVTQGEWRAVMGNNPAYFSACGDQCPVENVSWFDAVDYLNRLSTQEELETCYTISGESVTFKGLRCMGYRLPTEAEWEYAACAGTTGATYGALSQTAWYEENSGEKTHPVGQKQANAWGLYDMLGNVREWTGDWKGDYGSAAVTDPVGPAWGEDRVLRGCCWDSDTRSCRAAARSGGWSLVRRSAEACICGDNVDEAAFDSKSQGPSVTEAAYRNRDVGFRPARSIP